MDSRKNIVVLPILSLLGLELVYYTITVMLSVWQNVSTDNNPLHRCNSSVDRKKFTEITGDANADSANLAMFVDDCWLFGFCVFVAGNFGSLGIWKENSLSMCYKHRIKNCQPAVIRKSYDGISLK